MTLRGLGLAPVAFGALAAGVAAIGAFAAPQSVEPVAITAVTMLDASHGYGLAGPPNSFQLLWTTDGGHLWNSLSSHGAKLRASSPATIVGRDRYFSTMLSKHRFAVMRSIDGGKTWSDSRPFADRVGAPAVGQPLSLDARHLYLAVGEGAAAGSSGQSLWASDDGGASWRFVSRTALSAPRPGSLPSGCDKNGFGFASPERGWAGAYCAGGPVFFYRTNDGGRSWRRQPIGAPKRCACDTSAPRFFNAHDGVFWINGYQANGGGKPVVRLYWTHDGGISWQGSDPPLRGVKRMPQITIANATTVWIAAETAKASGGHTNTVTRTSDRGASWHTVPANIDVENYVLDPIDSRTAFASRSYLQRASIDVTHDGGRTWAAVSTLTSG